ncbi:hypothetical protein QE152_g38656 [Popillia japonica]|uniref:Uncharacterized protein n=1 Tax=Popillia japonica TaxID=7064 RepID=A0AAW1HWR6_POPJA
MIQGLKEERVSIVNETQTCHVKLKALKERLVSEVYKYYEKLKLKALKERLVSEVYKYYEKFKKWSDEIRQLTVLQKETDEMLAAELAVRAKMSKHGTEVTISGSTRQDEVRKTTEGLETTTASYKIPIDTLNERYGKTGAIVDTHLIYDLRMRIISEDETIESIRKNVDHIISVKEPSNRIKGDTDDKENFTIENLYVEAKGRCMGHTFDRPDRMRQFEGRYESC